MELASSSKWRIRQALQGDARAIGRLLGTATLRHLHVDWHLPVDWLGTPGFVLCERERAPGEMELMACLAVGADPPPAAWVRVAAVKGDADMEQCLQEMLPLTLPWLQENSVSILGWLPEQTWPKPWLTALGFVKVNWIVTYGMDLTDGYDLGGVSEGTSPATESHMPRLAEIEEQAFEPLWRHSQPGLMRAFGRAISFDVAQLDGHIVGFQYSVAGQDDQSAHLVRLTVAPEAQGRGVGSNLMRAALNSYRKIGARHITLNTQLDNVASHRLYERFGFRRLSGGAAVWALELT